MRPVVIEIALDTEGPPEVVWNLLTDWERQGEWMLEASDFVVTTPHREGVGVVAEATVKIGGLKTRDQIRVDVWEPRRHLGIEHLGWVSGRGDLVLTPTATGTRIDWREELVPPLGILGAIGIRAFRPLMAWVFRRDLRVLGDIIRSETLRRYPG